MNFARRVFQFAGIYGIIALVPQYFLEERTGRDFPPAITHPEFFYGFTGVALAWQIAFLIIARDPVRYKPIMWCGILEKLSFGIATIVLYLMGRVAWFPPAAGVVDLIWCVLFYMAIRKTPDRAV
jgi:hypothetical protein